MRLLAQTSLGTIGGGAGLGPFANGGDGVTGIAKIISSAVGILTVAAGVWFLFNIIIAGFSWISAGGDKAKLTSAREKITNALIGLVVVVASWAILALAGAFFGIDFTDLGGLMQNLSQ